MEREKEIIDRELLPQDIHRRVIDGTIEVRKAFRLLKNLMLYNRNQEIKAEAAKYRISLVKTNTAWQDAQSKINIEKYVNEGVHPSEAPILALLEIYVDVAFVKGDIREFYNYEIDDEGHIIRLDVFGSDEFYIGVFPQQICELRFLRELYFPNQGIRIFPECIKNLTNLKTLDLSDNKMQDIPAFVKKLPHLKELYLADKEVNMSHRNVFEFIDVADIKENLSVKKMHEIFKELYNKEQTERENLTRKLNEQKEPLAIIYPPKEILSTPPETPRNFEYSILWMLNNNLACGWPDFKKDPVNISQATLSKYLSLLVYNRYVYRVSKGYYMITESGKRRLSEIESSINK